MHCVLKFKVSFQGSARNCSKEDEFTFNGHIGIYNSNFVTGNENWTIHSSDRRREFIVIITCYLGKLRYCYILFCCKQMHSLLHSRQARNKKCSEDRLIIVTILVISFLYLRYEINIAISACVRNYVLLISE
jgi:hypothetical protein